MPSDKADDGTTSYPRSVPSDEEKARIRAELAGSFSWASSVLPVTRPLHDLGAMTDLNKLAEVAAAANNRKELFFTLVSKEYINTGLNWVYAIRRLGLSNFLVIAGDKVTYEQFDQLGVHVIHVDIDESKFDESFVSHVGFTAKGLAMIALKFPVTNFLLQCGYNVTFSDSDAVWLRDPTAYLQGTDIAFQRVAHHPPQISSLWSFAACTGFVFFRHSKEAITFMGQCITEHRSFYSDQVAMNLALLEANPDWVCEHGSWMPPGGDIRYDKDQRLATFAKLMQFPIIGQLRQSRLKALALPHDKFWRHLWVTASVPDMVICHPNSPKDDLEKMKIFDTLGIRFPPQRPT
jgi:Nucleotide-diphospho-sugar transferase